MKHRSHHNRKRIPMTKQSNLRRRKKSASKKKETLWHPKNQCFSRNVRKKRLLENVEREKWKLLKTELGLYKQHHQPMNKKNNDVSAKEAQPANCLVCSLVFDSKNKLFAHIKETGHTALKSAHPAKKPKPAKNVKKSGKRK